MRHCRILTTVMLLVFLSVSHAAAQVHNMPLTKLGYDSDIVVSGAQRIIHFHFPLPAGTLHQDSFLQLTVEPAQYLHATGSFTFFINDKPVLSTSVAKLRASPNLKIPLDASVMQHKFLRLTIKSNVFVTDDTCIDYSRGQLYYTVRKTSYMRLQFTPAPVLTIPDFFRSLSSGLNVIIPDRPTANELTAGAWAYGVIQKTFPYYPVKIIRASERDKYPTIPRVWVATRNHLPSVLTKGQTDIHLPFANALVITGKDETALKHNALSLEKLMQLEVLPAISANAELLKADSAASDKVSFGNPSVQEGYTIVPINFLLYPAQLETIPRSLGIRLEGRYSVHIRPEHSVRLDVYFNRDLVHSELLDHSGQLKKDIILPEHLMLKARNVLTTEFRYPEVDGACEVRGPSQTAQIFLTSYFVGSGKFSPDAHAWDTLGLTFLRPGMVALDDMTEPEAPDIAARLALLINNQLPEGKYAFPEFIALNELNSHKPENYLIIAGLAEKLPENVQRNLPIKPGALRTTVHQQNSAMLYNHRVDAKTVIGQTSIYKDTPLAVISANSSRTSLVELLDRLNTLEGQSKLSGNILLYNSPDTLAFVDTRDPRVQLPKTDTMTLLREYWEMAMRIIEKNRYLAITVFSIIFILFLCWVYQKLKTNKNENIRK